MTDDFASTMVTVIPIVLVVGTAEVATFTRTAIAELRNPDGTGRNNVSVLSAVKALVKLCLAAAWTALVYLHADVEVDLIAWLATPERTNNQDLASRVVRVSETGFHFVVVVAVLLFLFRWWGPEGTMELPQKRARAESQRREQSKPSPSSRRRPRPLYPAHRAVRRPSRRNRSTPGR
ncbi:hypothetical protein ABZ568_00325 [Streptomyces olindensis]|uniref:Uncharacterized protein n=1 Tax=Streptomyces olindensis TaxID=358823 RepID=A0ABV2XLM7_9ACTN